MKVKNTNEDMVHCSITSMEGITIGTRSREKQLKSGQGKAYLRKRLKRFLTLSG